MYIYTCIYIYIYICIYVNIYTYIYIYIPGRGNMSEKYFAAMLEDLGLNAEAQTVSELFLLYDEDLDGRLLSENFSNCFQVIPLSLFFSVSLALSLALALSLSLFHDVYVCHMVYMTYI